MLADRHVGISAGLLLDKLHTQITGAEVASRLERQALLLEMQGEQEGRKEVWATKSSCDPLKQMQFDLYILMQVKQMIRKTQCPINTLVKPKISLNIVE